MKKSTVTASFVTVAALAMGGFAFAYSHGAAAQDHSGHGDMEHGDHAGHGMAATDDMPASTQAYIAANDVMHRDMAIEFTGDADADFILGMIPHHQGAVAMAEIVLQYGADPDVAQLAQEIIAAQREEIDWMQNWLAERGY